MKAARGFTHGDGSKTHRFQVGDEVPDKIVKQLDEEVANLVILELAAKANPDVLTRGQLLELAGLTTDEVPKEVEAEFDEDQFREAMGNFNTKGDLIEWAETTLGIEGLEKSWRRPEIEDAIVGAYTAEDEDE
ncbi:hypothetical protein LCGC14_2496580 [marine sediment metagenome]|uniref:Uncharacterized protein n=1 Tax=marine sediment metagenome TaxID=412755 RepID=A0A0F9DWX2_9ZZZZ